MMVSLIIQAYTVILSCRISLLELDLNFDLLCSNKNDLKCLLLPAEIDDDSDTEEEPSAAGEPDAEDSPGVETGGKPDAEDTPGVETGGKPDARA